ncbi:MAG: peptidylprolyl isomerase [Candidatus Zixiibacteriota bacterium]
MKLAHEIEEARTSSSEVVISLPKGDVTIDLDYDAAPLTCLNFTQLIKDGFYENLVFHRVIPNFVAQGGDPRGDGWGGPGYNIRCEYSERSYKRGTVGIATSGKDTGGSQFFITLSAQPHLDARYTIIGEVASGMEHVDGILRGDVARSISIAAAVQ